MGDRVAHFEIPSKDPKKSMEFFSTVFGWTFEKFGNNEYWFAKTGDDKTPGINGAVMKEVAPGQPLVNSIFVEDIDESIQKIETAGGRIVKPKFAIPTVGWLAFFADPDGNLHGVSELDPTVK